MLQMTEDEFFAGAHKLSAPQCVNAQHEEPHLGDLLGCCHPTASHYGSVPALNIQSHDVTLNTLRDQV